MRPRPISDPVAVAKYNSNIDGGLQEQWSCIGLTAIPHRLPAWNGATLLAAPRASGSVPRVKLMANWQRLKTEGTGTVVVWMVLQSADKPHSDACPTDVLFTLSVNAQHR
ncbi:hypothetical protein CBL_11803 [Carabus blaptoides fortunei]